MLANAAVLRSKLSNLYSSKVDAFPADMLSKHVETALFVARGRPDELRKSAAKSQDINGNYPGLNTVMQTLSGTINVLDLVVNGFRDLKLVKKTPIMSLRN